MTLLTGTPIRRVAGFLGFPPGTGELVSHPTRRKLVISVGLSVLLSMLDALGVLAMVPLMQFVTGQSHDSGALGRINQLLGDPGDRTLVLAVSGLIVGSFVVKDVAALAVRRWQLKFMATEQVTTSARLLEGYLKGPYAWQLLKNTGDRLWTVQGSVGQGYTGGLSAALSAITETLTIFFIFVCMLFVSATATLVALVYLGVAGIVVQRVIRPRIQSAGELNLAASKRVSKSSLQSLTAGKEIKLRRAHARFVDDFRTSNIDAAHANVTATLLGEVPRYFMEIVFVCGVGLLAALVTTGEDSSKGLLLLGVFVAAGTRILASAVRLISAVSGLRYAHAPLVHLLSEVREMDYWDNFETTSVTTDAVPSGDVQLSGIQFSYLDRPDDLVLRGIDLHIPEGTTIAFVGGSGAGKSTLVDLLLGLHTPTAGSILAGGVNIHHNLPAWQRTLAVVPQDVTLLDETLAANICFDEPFDAEHMTNTLRRAQLSDLIESLPEGLDTEIGERGVRLSGGQRQRIGIARALYRRPSLLVLDEATSALDNETERRLTETMDSLKGSMTIIVVAHRLSTVRHCDSLAFFSNGNIVGYGTFDEVAASTPEFANLVRLAHLGEQVREAESGQPES